MSKEKSRNKKQETQIRDIEIKSSILYSRRKEETMKHLFESIELFLEEYYDSFAK